MSPSILACSEQHVWQLSTCFGTCLLIEVVLMFRTKLWCPTWGLSAHLECVGCAEKEEKGGKGTKENVAELSA